jgi:hypothetical protein
MQFFEPATAGLLLFSLLEQVPQASDKQNPRLQQQHFRCFYCIRLQLLLSVLAMGEGCNSWAPETRTRELNGTTLSHERRFCQQLDTRHDFPASISARPKYRQVTDSWNLTSDEWRLMSRCNKCARQLFPFSAHAAEAWARSTYFRCQAEGVSPETLRDRRSPGITELRARRNPNLAFLYID